MILSTFVILYVENNKTASSFCNMDNAISEGMQSLLLAAVLEDNHINLFITFYTLLPLCISRG